MAADNTAAQHPRDLEGETQPGGEKSERMGGYIQKDEAQAILGTFSDGQQKREERQDDVSEWFWIRNGIWMREMQL